MPNSQIRRHPLFCYNVDMSIEGEDRTQLPIITVDLQKQLRKIAGGDWRKIKQEVWNLGALVWFNEDQIVGFRSPDGQVFGQPSSTAQAYVGHQGAPQAGLKETLASYNPSFEDLDPDRHKKAHSHGGHWGRPARGKHRQLVRASGLKRLVRRK